MKDRKKNNFRKISLNIVFWVIIVAIFGTIWLSQSVFSGKLKEVAISDVITRANKGEISKIEIQGNDVRVTKKGDKKPTEKSVKESFRNNLEFSCYDCASYCDCSFLYADYAFGEWPEFTSNELWEISSKTLR